MLTLPKKFVMAEVPNWIVEERGGYRFPPGLKLNLPLYLSRRFFRVGNPILLFEHLTATYGKMAHYRVGPSDIVLVSEPEFIREILIVQAPSFIKGAHAEADEDSAGRRADHQRRRGP